MTQPVVSQPLTDTERAEVELELATLHSHIERLKLNPPSSGPFGHNALNVQLWQEHIARAEREAVRLEALLS